MTAAQVFAYFLSAHSDLSLNTTSAVTIQNETVTRSLLDLTPAAPPPPPPPPPATTVAQLLSDIQSLYQGFNPDLFQGWFVGNASECSFPGIKCNAEGGITELVLKKIIPKNTTDDPVFGGLEAIEQLISLVPTLRVLVFTSANMVGQIPSVWPPNLEVSLETDRQTRRMALIVAILSCYCLRFLALSLSVSVCVQVLNLEKNKLSGYFGESGLNLLPSLKQLTLKDNEIMGFFPDFSSSALLELVDVANNLLEGNLDDTFGSMNVTLAIKGNKYESMIL